MIPTSDPPKKELDETQMSSSAIEAAALSAASGYY